MNKNKIAFLIDGSTNFDFKNLKNLSNVFVIPFNVINKSTLQTILDDNKTDVDNVIHEVLYEDKIYSTSQPSEKQFMQKLSYILNTKKYQHVIIYTIHSKLSATFKTAKNVQLMKEFKNKITVLSSKQILYESFYLLKLLVITANNGKNLEEILRIFKSYKSSSRYFGIFRDLEKAKNSGRFGGKLASYAFNTFKLKLCAELLIDHDTFKPKILALKRTDFKCIDKIESKVTIKKYNSLMLYSSNYEDNDIQQIIQIVKNEFPTLKLYYSNFPPIITILVGKQICFEFNSNIEEFSFYKKI